jgi:SNF2 family DNA or RNA helicase
VLELYSLFRFLRTRPLDDWEDFRDRIVKPMDRGQVGLAMKRLHVLLKAIMLRRTKDAKIGE